MTDTPPSSDSRPVTGSNPPSWALAEIRDDSKSPGDHHSAPVATSSMSDGSPGSKVSSKPSRMVQPSDFQFGKELGSGSWSTVRLTAINIRKKLM